MKHVSKVHNMKWTAAIDNQRDLHTWKNYGGNEVLLECQDLARFGRLNLSTLHELALKARQLGLRCVLVWDLLMTEKVFDQKLAFLKGISWDLFDSIRVLDPGAALWAKRNLDSMPVQLIVEHGHHNLSSLQIWKNMLGPTLERVILSLELTKEQIALYCKELELELELLVLGKILLFSTPRQLLSPLFDKRQQWLEVSGQSEESPHKGFPIIQNQHGTFMFNVKDYCLLDVLDELQLFGLSWSRMEVSSDTSKLIGPVLNLGGRFDEQEVRKIKDQYPHELIRGFYSVNKTDVLFKKLKNQNTQRSDDLFIGHVLETVKGKHTAIDIKNSKHTIFVGDHLNFLTTDGLKVISPITWIKTLDMKEIDQFQGQGVVLVNPIKKTSTKAAVYKNS